MLFYFDWAKKMGLMPLMVHGYENELKKGNYFYENLWEYCFEQEDINRVLKEENIIVYAINGGITLRETCYKLNNDIFDMRVHAKINSYRDYYRKVYELTQRNWKFNDVVQKKVEDEYSKLLQKQGKIMAVILREEFSLEKEEMTEAEKKVYCQHPKALTLEETYQKILEYMNKWECEYVYVSTMFLESIAFFVERLEDRVVYFPRQRKMFQDYMNALRKGWEYSDNKDSDNYERNRKEYWRDQRKINEQDYCAEIMVAAKCDYCIGVKSSGLIAALALNGGQYKDIYIFEDKNLIDRY